MSNPIVWLPLITAVVGFAFGAFIGHSIGSEDGYREARDDEAARLRAKRRNRGAK